MPLSRYDGASVVYAAHMATGETDTSRLVLSSVPGLLRAAIPFRDGMIDVEVVQVSPTRKVGYPVFANARDILTSALKPAALALIPATILAPLTLLLLPISLRRARVRPRHFVRLLAYTTALLIPVAICISVADHFVRLIALIPMLVAFLLVNIV